MGILETAIIISCLPILALGLLRSRVLRPLAFLLLILPAILVAVHSYVDGLKISDDTSVYRLGISGYTRTVHHFFPATVDVSVFGKTWGSVHFRSAYHGGSLSWWYPIFELPVPTGPYPIGSRILQMDGVDKDKLVMRKLTVQIWYPATKDIEGLHMPYLDSSESWGFGSFSSFRIAKTHAYANARVSNAVKKWPVIIYSPPWEGGTFQNTTLFESLASEGFVVVAVELPVTSAALPPLDFESEESIRQFQAAAKHELEMRTSDVLRVYAGLDALNGGILGNGVFKNKLNLKAVGVMGYSFGGAVAAEALTRETGLQAGANFDGTLFGKAAQQGATQPFLFVTDTESTPSDRDLHSSDAAIRRNAEFFAQSLQQMNNWLATHGGWLVMVQGAQHTTYCDISLYAYRGVFGKANREKATDTLKKINSCTLAFFDQTLRGNVSPLMQKDSFPWPGVEVRKFDPSQVKNP